VIRRFGTVVLVVGVGLLAWTATVYFWQDPFTTAYTALEQRRLEQSFERELEDWKPVTKPKPQQNGSKPRPVAEAKRADVRREAVAYARTMDEGDAIARLRIPRMDLDVVVVNGTDAGDLRRGPGRHLDTALPGQRELVYVAGHRTTFGAPFSDIDELQPGDRITLELPYASFEYRVTRHRIVDQHDLSVLRSEHREELALQACHPRFFASERYIVYARPVHVTERRAGSAAS
jgi:sortase A